MQHNECLNCGTTIVGKYCSNCGQKTDTHRITFKHFLAHEMLHGVWHLEKGILFTVKEALTRPGYAALDYIAGKRFRYYNMFYLMLLVLALILFAAHHTESKEAFDEAVLDDDDNYQKLVQFIDTYIKPILFTLVPLLAINSYVLYRRLKLNFLEHVIISGFTSLAMFVTALVAIAITVKYHPVTDFISDLLFWVMLLFPILAYYQVSASKYKFWGFAWRLVLFYLLLILEIISIISFFTIVFLL
ncbi:DUF3667 domain-containing protein [Flavobacterium litorale]|uniref:DUF3667 domain-containing protein n=1 Tax=Flavobacterium litorale TaxID=2856519 RepID=A0ABX8V8C7_9FLAO|nr:DUF3667 domain-containing protein [Flavobacterium litorale]QYJ68378.1 DUF3667 domain-containing protein [Flavobacterium litorale]